MYFTYVCTVLIIVSNEQNNIYLTPHDFINI
jgi:hypothetical protein